MIARGAWYNDKFLRSLVYGTIICYGAKNLSFASENEGKNGLLTNAEIYTVRKSLSMSESFSFLKKGVIEVILCAGTNSFFKI